MPNNSNILPILTFYKPRKVYDGGDYNYKCQAAEFNFHSIP